MGNTVHAEYSPEGGTDPLTVLIDAVAEYKDVSPFELDTTASTLGEVGIDQSVDINKFVTDSETSGELVFQWDDMCVTVDTTGKVTVREHTDTVAITDTKD